MKTNRLYFYVIAFFGGLVSLAVELSASRLLGPYFGDSLLVWTAVIGLILIYLTGGYFLGGRWADRSPYPCTLYQIVAWAAFLIGIVPFVARPILTLSLRGFHDFDLGLLGGSLWGVLVLFAAPVTLLGCISPFVVRLAVVEVATVGRVAGRVYAVSTMGSFLGTFLPVLVLIPNLGTRNTFVLLSLLLLAVALVGLVLTDHRRLLLYLWMPAVVILLALLLRGQPVKEMEGTIHEAESAYNYIQVVERAGTRYLLLNEGQGVHSVYNPAQLRTFGTWDYFLIAPFFNPPSYTPQQVRSVAIIGLAAGTTPRQYTLVYGPLPIDGVEIDPEIVRVGREFFGMQEPNLNVVVADGRYFLSHSRRQYTVVGVDAYRLPYIPWHLTTVEFFSLVRDHLTDDGVVVVNVGRTPEDWRLVEAMVATLRWVFPSTHVIDLPGTFSAVVVATVHESVPENLRTNLEGLEPGFLREVSREAWENLRPTEPGPLVFTDDRAPVEQLTHAIVLRYAMGGKW